MGERAESAISVVETPTDATETVALPEKSLRIWVRHAENRLTLHFLPLPRSLCLHDPTGAI
jgi:hypothetical protein